MKITEDVRKYLAEQGIAEKEALKKGMEERPKESAGRGTELYPKPSSASAARWSDKSRVAAFTSRVRRRDSGAGSIHQPFSSFLIR